MTVSFGRRGGRLLGNCCLSTHTSRSTGSFDFNCPITATKFPISTCANKSESPEEQLDYVKHVARFRNSMSLIYSSLIKAFKLQDLGTQLSRKEREPEILRYVREPNNPTPSVDLQAPVF